MIVRHKSTMKPILLDHQASCMRVTSRTDNPKSYQFLRDHNASERLIKTALDGLEPRKWLALTR